ncbi:DNA polymerase epsilon subunit 2, partial [Nowakowskiella sp. JEL0078]
GTEKVGLFCDAIVRTEVFRDRFDVILQRIQRNENFRPPPVLAMSDSEYFEITPIKSLVGGKLGDSFLLFGMLTQMEEGKFHLEDKDSTIQLEFINELDQTVGLFTQCCFVLMEGVLLENKVFEVRMVGMPPPEDRNLTLSVFGSNVDFYPTKHSEDSLIQIEKKHEDVTLVMLSDVWLDVPEVLAKLRILFEGYSNAIIPLAFIFFGNFTSGNSGCGAMGMKKIQECFSTFADLICEFPSLLNHSQFIFIPGPSDPFVSEILPRPSIPNRLTERIRSKVPNSRFLSNPARLKYCSQEIVLFREDIVKKMRRNCILKPDLEQEGEIKRHLVKTIIDQGHLVPLTPNTQPTYWGFDHDLRLYPIPQVMVLADRHDTYSITYEKCISLNPGSFPNNGYTFLVYYPATRKVEERHLL